MRCYASASRSKAVSAPDKRSVFDRASSGAVRQPPSPYLAKRRTSVGCDLAILRRERIGMMLRLYHAASIEDLGEIEVRLGGPPLAAGHAPWRWPRPWGHRSRLSEDPSHNVLPRPPELGGTVVGRGQRVVGGHRAGAWPVDHRGSRLPTGRSSGRSRCGSRGRPQLALRRVWQGGSRPWTRLDVATRRGARARVVGRRGWLGDRTGGAADSRR